MVSKPPKRVPIQIDSTTEFEDAARAVRLLEVKRRVDAKRRQGGRTFLDHLLIDLRAGPGGDGSVAFFRDVHQPNGPPSGGNGGAGGDVLVKAVPGLTSLSGLAHLVKAGKGEHGKGKWRHGKRGADLVLRVPLGTVVRELSREKPLDPWDDVRLAAEHPEWESLDEAEREKLRRRKVWVHYPSKEEDNASNEQFLDAEGEVKKELRHALWRQRKENESRPGLELDLSEPTEGEGIIVARGGKGGLGNPFFASTEVRKPMWGTKGREGDSVRLFLELKLLADVGLVGLPNAGKSTLLRALTNAKAEVAGYAFTTLNPQVGTVQMYHDGGFGSSSTQPIVHTADERELSALGLLPPPTAAIHAWDRSEEDRLTICDNPGLLYRASEDVGLGHTFLRSVERARALVYVLDLSAPNPWDDLYVLKHELEAYRPGLSERARLIVANKADLLGAPGGEESDVQAARETEQEAWEKVRRLEELAWGLDVVPVSAKFRMGLDRVVALLREYVAESKAKEGQGM
ncbi:GTP-binding protein Obg/CgtA [Dacryopinax primogenitus]|uniref:GTP-binding protein Obg/CgtA n=1 Tax=Dacryopinax primogenitus (strain DJM 731) TaxID=1858805 RepID=M5FZL4_DACPD|nr:GTP-binding protein Obg/CgtA [Dacryopinax primogenitus]EJU01325.1 GTP-binding protein Obg/CgtA [Dacryopinax primogenitus]